MQLRLAEKTTFEKLTGDVPELFVVLVTPDDNGDNVTSPNGEIRMWIEPYVYAADGSSRSVRLVVKIGMPLIRNSGKVPGVFDMIDRVIGIVNGFPFVEGLSWRTDRATFDRVVGTMTWYAVRFEATENLA